MPHNPLSADFKNHAFSTPNMAIFIIFSGVPNSQMLGESSQVLDPEFGLNVGFEPVDRLSGSSHESIINLNYDDGCHS